MNDADRVARIIGDWCERRDQGEDLTADDLYRAYPELASELKAGLMAMNLVEQALHDTGDVPSFPQGVPEEIGGYRLVREIGRGGMGVIYEAEQIKMGRRVALKLLAPNITSVAQAVKRFQREARAAGTLHHTNIVPIYEMDQQGGYWFYAMELIHGRSLSNAIDEMRQGEPEAGGAESRSASRPSDLELDSVTDTGHRDYFSRIATMFASVAEALAVAHEAGVIHRDIKPANLLLDVGGELKIVDFGLAHLEDHQLSMTHTGQMLGTPRYMSPEQAMAKRMGIDHRTDIYSLGATLYEVLTLHPPFDADTLQDLCSQIITKDPALPRRKNPSVPRDLETVCLKAMSKDRDERYQTAAAFARDLRVFAEGGAVRARRIGIAGRTWRRAKRHKVRTALLAAAVLLAALGTFFAVRAAEEGDRRRDLEYAELVEDGYEALARSSGSVIGGMPTAGRDPRSYFTEAIELRPERPEAYVARALTSKREEGDQFQSDLEESRRRGVSERTLLLLRALRLRNDRRPDEAEELEARAQVLERGGPLDALIEGRIFYGGERYEESMEAYARAIQAFREQDGRHAIARRNRGVAAVKAGRFEQALGDLLAAHARGSRGLGTRAYLAAAWIAVGKPEQAEALYSEMLDDARTTGTVDACDAIAGVLIRAGVRVQIPAWWLRLGDAAIAIDESDFRGHYWRAHALSQDELSAPGSALDACDRALALFPEDSNDPRNPWLYVTRSHCLGKLHRRAEARQAAERAVEIDPDLSHAHSALSKALWNVKDFDGSLEASKRALELDPRSGDALVLMAFGMALRHRTAEALTYIDRAIEVSPNSAGGYTFKSRFLRKMGRHEDALETIRKGVRLKTRMPDPHHEHACVLSALGRPDEALAAIKRALDIDPNHAMSLYKFGTLLRDTQQYDEADEIFAKAQKLDPQGVDIALQRSNIAIFQGQNEDALKHQDRALRLLEENPVWREPAAKAEADENRVHLYLDRAAALLNLGRSKEALPMSEKAVELATATKDALLGRALALRAAAKYRLGSHAAALGDAQRALEVDPDRFLKPEERSLHEIRLAALKALGRIDDGFRAIDKLLEEERLDPTFRAWLLGQQGSLLLNAKKQHEEALALTEEALKLDPGLTQAHSLKGLALCNLRRYEEAIPALAAAAKPEGPYRRQAVRVLKQLARHFLQKEARESRRNSLRAVDAAIAATPNDAAAHSLRSQALRALGRGEAAVAAATRALELQPDSVGIRRVHVHMLTLVRPEEGLRALDRILDAQPTDAFAHKTRALALALLGRNSESLAAYDALVKDPEQSKLFSVVNNRAAVLAAMQRYEEALKGYEAAGLLSKSDAWVNGVMTVYQAQGRHEEAAEYAARASLLSVGPSLVYSLRALGREDEALQIAKRFLAANYTESISAAYLAAVAGDETLARKLMQKKGLFLPVGRALLHARIYGVLRDKRGALASLGEAIKLGFRPDLHAKNPELAWLEDDADYKELLASARKRDSPR